MTEDSDRERLIEAINRHKRPDGTVNYTDLGAEIGLHRSNAKRRVTQLAASGELGFDPVMPGFAVTKVSSAFNGDGDLTSEHITQKPAVDEKPFAVGLGRSIGKITSHVRDGNVVQEWVRTSPDRLAFIDAIKAAFDKYEGRHEPTYRPSHQDSDLLSIYPIADQHNGLLAWGQETGEAYDLEIGRKRLLGCASRLVAMSPYSHKAVILNLGDWQHTDDQKNMTPRSGNVLDVDSRYFKILTTGVELQNELVQVALKRHAEVEVVNIPGNHDPHASVALTVAMASFYRREPRVTVWDKPANVWFKRFGKTLIGATHGHTMKPDRMAMTLATRCRKDWGETAYHHFYFGHIHHESAKEVGDVRCESFQTLAAKDAHASHAGYNSGQSLTSITIHREEGEIGRHRVNLPPPEFRACEDR